MRGPAQTKVLMADLTQGIHFPGQPRTTLRARPAWVVLKIDDRPRQNRSGTKSLAARDLDQYDGDEALLLL